MSVTYLQSQNLKPITYLCLCLGFFEQIMYTYLPPFLLTLLQPSHSFLTELRTFIPRTCSLLTSFLKGLAGFTLSFWKADVRDCDCEPHVREEHDRANVGNDARVLIEGAAKERRSARAAGVESMGCGVLLSSIQEVCESTVCDLIRMDLMTPQGGMSLRCGWYSTTTRGAGVHRQSSAGCPCLAQSITCHCTLNFYTCGISHITLRHPPLHVTWGQRINEINAKMVESTTGEKRGPGRPPKATPAPKKQKLSQPSTKEATPTARESPSVQQAKPSGLPSKISASAPLPVLLDKSQPVSLSDSEYQSLASSAVLAASLERSQHAWTRDGIFQRFWKKPEGRQKGPDLVLKSMKDKGRCRLRIEPHIFEVNLWVVTKPRPPPAPKSQVQPAPYQPQQQTQYYSEPATTTSWTASTSRTFAE